MSAFVDYHSDVDDNRRWAEFAHRPGDIVVSTRSKHGTTWVQRLVLGLVHGPELPAPLAELSPWLDHLVEPIEVVIDRLSTQRHRRVVKTHTPLDGLPLRTDVHYIVVARHPLDAAVSLYHQGSNIDRVRVAELTGAPIPRTDRPELRTWLLGWIAHRVEPTLALDGVEGVLAHIRDAWARRQTDNVTLVHYADLLVDLRGELGRLAGRLGFIVDEPTLDAVVAASSFVAMRDDADRYVPDRHGVMRDRGAFFRRGTSGAAREVLRDDEIEEYTAFAATRLPREAHAWLHRQ